MTFFSDKFGKVRPYTELGLEAFLFILELAASLGTFYPSFVEDEGIGGGFVSSILADISKNYNITILILELSTIKV